MKATGKKTETYEEAGRMAAEYFNILGTEKKKKELAKEAHNFSDELAKHDVNLPLFKIQEDEEELDEFMAERRKMEIYDKLVRSLYKLTK